MVDYTLTLSGSVQRLSDALTPSTPGGLADVACRFLSIQPDGANANPIYFGAAATLSTTLFGLRFPAGSGGIPSAPLILSFDAGGTIKLSHCYVLGTAGEKLHLLTIPS